MPKYSFRLNGERVQVDAPADLAALWTLRDKLGVTGPKYGCGINVCKACTSLVDGKAFNPCATNTSDLQGRDITTIEGLADGDVLHPVQEAWLEQDVPQCGYCQPGQIMSAVDLLRRTSNPTDAEIDAIENVCRCGTYFRVRQAIKSAAAKIQAAGGVDVAGLAPGAGGGAVSASDVSAPVEVAAGSSALAATGGAGTVAAAGAAVVGAGAVAAKVAEHLREQDGPAPA